jgi:hypothetical protein
MAKELEASRPGCSPVGFLVWFLGGISLSLSIIFSLFLLILLIASVTLNVYLGWELSGLEITISRTTPAPPQVVTATLTPEAMAAIPDETPAPEVTGSPTPLPADVQLERQLGTVAAIATQASTSDDPAAFVPPPPTAATVPIDPTGEGGQGSTSEPSTLPEAQPVAQAATPPPSTPPARDEVIGSVTEDATPSAGQAPRSAAITTSSNTYQLIPIDGERESRPAEAHGDLNLKLREPQPIDVELALVDAGVGVDPDAPKLSKVFSPEFTAVYTVHDWDWGCNCKGKLIEEDTVVLAGIKTTPGEPIYIPPREQDIYDRKYYAVVLYASEDSLTFLYNRAGTVVQGYTIHYVGLQTDPNLVALFRESQGNQLPGLTLDTPVGIATGELLVAIRDNGKFLDTRSQHDWWD